MKKILSAALAIFLTFSLSACTKTAKKSDENKGTTTGKYKDGTYTGKGDPWQYGSEEAIVEIKDSKITSIILKRLDKEGKEVNYEDWRGQEVGGKVNPNLKQYRMDMSKKMLEKQSSDVDTITGATVSTKNWKVAVQRALDQAKK